MPRNRPKSQPAPDTASATLAGNIDMNLLQMLAMADVPEDEMAATLGVAGERLRPYADLIQRYRLQGRSMLRRQARELALSGNNSMMYLLLREQTGIGEDKIKRERDALEVRRLRVQVEQAERVAREEEEQRRTAEMQVESQDFVGYESDEELAKAEEAEQKKVEMHTRTLAKIREARAKFHAQPNSLPRPDGGKGSGTPVN